MVDTDSTPGPASRVPEFVPHLPFLLASSNEWSFGEGAADLLTVEGGEDLVRAADRFLAPSHASNGPAVLVGALSFLQDAPPFLFRPKRWTRTLPDPAALRAILPQHEGRRPATWTVRARPSRQEYARSVAEAVAAIEESHGALRKVVLSRSLVLSADAPIVVADIVNRLLVDPSVATFIVPLPSCTTGGRRALIGATPELLLSRRGHIVRSRPLAGSTRRALDPGEDAAAANMLLRSEKDLREHATVMEWIADRLAPFCRWLHVPKSPSLVSTATMWHLATDIHGELARTDVSSLELAHVLHPTPAVCGYPFEAAANLIGRLESFDRRFYTGALGWCDQTGDGDWYVAIRCADVCGHVAHLYAGAGIVAGSTPEGEAAETAAKFSALLNAIQPGQTERLVREAE